MDNLFKSANNSIMKYKGEYEKLKSTNENSYEKKLEGLKREYEMEKKRSEDEFKKYKETREREWRMMNEKERKRVEGMIE